MSRLKEQLATQQQPWFVPAARFFDGNDDRGSIGCNLNAHPGVEAFRDVLAGLLGRSDVEAVYSQIAELDPGEGSWPFTDTILVVGRISAAELRRAVSPLRPDEVGASEAFGIADSISERHGSPVLVVWWD